MVAPKSASMTLDSERQMHILAKKCFMAPLHVYVRRFDHTLMAR
jgi:hypothetical protein